jgi:hypothetical protein
MEFNNYKNPDAGCDKYGIYRLELAKYLRDNIFAKFNNKYFIENGTLLGAFRNQKFIPHDDDFDFGILIDSKDEINNINNIINYNLISNYKCRLIDSYCNKIEIYEPKYGKYILSGPKYNNQDYHYVTIDLQFYLKKNENIYDILYYIYPEPREININIILPLTKITLENEIFYAPNKVEEFLKINYNSLHPEAKYSNKTGKYHL